MWTANISESMMRNSCAAVHHNLSHTLCSHCCPSDTKTKDEISSEVWYSEILTRSILYWRGKKVLDGGEGMERGRVDSIMTQCFEKLGQNFNLLHFFFFFFFNTVPHRAHNTNTRAKCWWKIQSAIKTSRRRRERRHPPDFLNKKKLLCHKKS